MTVQVQKDACHFSLSPDLRVIAASANSADFLPAAPPAADLIGQPMTSLFSADATHSLRNSMALLRSDASSDHLFACPLDEGEERFDITIYRRGDAFGLDIERGNLHAAHDPTGMINGMVDRLDRCHDLETLGRAAAGQIRSMLGFDQVAIFLDDRVIGHSARPGSTMAPPASPAAIDRLVVVAADSAPVDLCGQEQVFTARSEFLSPADDTIAWLSAQGAKACFIVPIEWRGRRFGQLCCLHSSARRPGLERRSIVRLFVAIVAMRVEIDRLGKA